MGFVMEYSFGCGQNFNCEKTFLSLYESAATACGRVEATKKMIAELKKNESLAEKISNAIRSMHAEHDQLIEKIERYAK